MRTMVSILIPVSYTHLDENKESVLGAIKKYQAKDKEKPKEKKETSKEAER